MVDPQPVDHTFGDQAQRQLVGLLEDLRVLLPHPRQFVDVEEAPPATAHRVEVEVLLPQLLVGPIMVFVHPGHVVGDDVQDDPKASFGKFP